MDKRTWIYVHPPSGYECTCDKCGGSNTDWSEFEGMIWCFDCQIDTKGTGGVLGSGPLAIGLLELLGITLDRVTMDGKYLKCTQNEKGIGWKELTPEQTQERLEERRQMHIFATKNFYRPEEIAGE